jgi:putative transposase
MSGVEPELRRKSMRMPGHDYSQPGAYFVTTCTADRRCALGKVEHARCVPSPAGRIVATEWERLASRFPAIGLGAYAVMPNHLHGLVIIRLRRADTPVLGEIIRAFKAASTHLIRKAGDTGFAWQTDFRDQVIGSQAEYQAVEAYIVRNPSEWDRDGDDPDWHPLGVGKGIGY